MTPEEAQAVLDDLASTPEQIEAAMDALELEDEDDFDIWLFGFYRSMFRMWLLLLVVEGIAFGVMVATGNYMSAPVIVWSVGIASFMTGRTYERRKNRQERSKAARAKIEA